MAAEATAAPSARAAGAGLVLMTLAAGQFLMTLDSSVMNVSIATVAKDVGTTVTGIQGAITAYTLVMAALMITGAKVGAIIGRKRAFTIGCVIYGCGSLTTSLATSLPVLLFGWSFLEGVGAALIMPAIVALVASNFAAGAPAGRVRHGRRRRSGRGRRRSADRRLLHDVLLLALGLRRRGRRGARDPRRRAQDRRRAVRDATEARRRRHDPLRGGSRRARLRRPALERVGLDPAEAGRAVVGGALADDLADPDRRVRPVALPALGGSPRVAGPGDAHPSRLSPQPPARRRPDHVLLPVPRAGGVLLRRAAVSLGLPRPVGARDRRAAAAALGHAAHRRHRHPAAAAERVAATRRSHRPARAPRRHGGAHGRPRHRLGAGDRLRADAARRSRHRRPGVAARRDHGLGSTGRRDPRGRRRAEHLHEPRRVDGHGARGLDHDRRRLRVVPHEHPVERRDPVAGQGKRAGSARGRRSVRLRRRPGEGARRRRRARQGERRSVERVPGCPHQRARVGARDPRAACGRRAALHDAGPENATGRVRTGWRRNDAYLSCGPYRLAARPCSYAVGSLPGRDRALRAAEQVLRGAAPLDARSRSGWRGCRSATRRR